MSKTNEAAQSTVAQYYDQIIGDLRGNEQSVWQKLDAIQKQVGATKDSGMKAAVDAAEKIRQWEDHMWTTDKLAKTLGTDLKRGLTKEDAAKLLA